MEKKTFNWSALEYKKKDRSVDWYWAVGIITIAIIVIAIFLHNFLFAVLILISVITLMMYAVKNPRIVECYVNERGLKIDDYLYPFSEQESFWITNSEDDPKLILKPKRTIMPLTIIEIREIDPSELRMFILNFLSERQIEEPVPHKIMDFLGF